MKLISGTRLWDWAGRIYHEAIFQGSLSSAGSNRQRLMERMDNDARYIVRQARMAQILGSFYLLMITFLPAATMAQLSGGVTHQWNLLVTSLAGTLHFLVQTGYLMILTLIATSEILASNLYRWPESLPISSRQVGLLRIMALGRELLLPLCMIVVSYPIAAAVSGGVAATLVALAITLCHAGVTLSVIVLVSWRLRRALRSASGDSRRATTVRIITMAGYGLGIVIILAIMQFGTNLVAGLFDEPRANYERSLSTLRILSLLPLPTAPASLISGMVARRAGISNGLAWWYPLIGTGLYAAAGLGLLRAAWRLIGRSEADTQAPAASETPRAAPLRVRTARAAFRRQIYQTATRDTQILLALIFPLVVPALTLVGPRLTGMPGSTLIHVIPMVAAIMGGWMLVHGLSRLQVGTGQLEASLPLTERDRAFPRLSTCAIVPAAGAALAAIVVLPGSLKLQGVLLSAVPAATVPVGFIIKTVLFGRGPGSGVRAVTVEEVYVNRRFFKWLATILLVAVLSGGLVVLRIVLLRALAEDLAAGLFLFVVVIVGLLARVVAGRVFPAADVSVK